MNRSHIKTLDILWSKTIKILWGNRCARCRRTECLDSHHIIGKRNFRVRWYVENGICLCRICHQWGHSNPLLLKELISKVIKPATLEELKIESINVFKPIYEYTLEYLKETLEEIA